MSSSSKPQGLVSQKYEIAEPIAYPVFAVPGTPAAALLQNVIKPIDSGPFHEKWDDSGKAMPFLAKLGRLATPQEDEKKEVHLVEGKPIQRETRAVWIVHGMGQQIPFETVDNLAQGLLSVAQPQNVKPRLRTVKIGDQVLQRVELDVDGFANQKQEPDKNNPNSKDIKATDKPLKYYELHLYESYWAPKTEGVAKLADVISFLLDGGSRGLLNWLQKFKRAMFGGMEQFNVSRFTPVWLLLTLSVLLALTIINGVIAAAAAAHLKAGGSYANLSAQWDSLAALASAMTAVAFTFGTVLFLAETSKPSGLRQGVRLLLSTVTWLALAATLWSILKTAALMAMSTYFSLTALQPSDPRREEIQGFSTLVILGCAALAAAAMSWRAALRSSGVSSEGDGLLLFLFLLAFALNVVAVVGPLESWNSDFPFLTNKILSNSIWVWPFLIALSAQVRTLMVQYVGDVAIYVTPNKLDRFDEVRNKIKEAARSVVSAVYMACKPNTNSFLYDHVALVGHSLGSVIAYDTLNRLMLDDWLSKNHLGIAHRTRCMVTFGSPLNKTAFLFTIQGKDTLRIRERLAATVQPLIQSYPKFRKFKWINVWSRNDIICGSLQFYDLPGMQKLDPLPDVAVHNEVDKDAAVPLVAHVDYWKNKLVWERLYQEIAP